MKKYTAPEIECTALDTSDVITCSFGNLESLPTDADTPIYGISGGNW